MKVFWYFLMLFLPLKGSAQGYVSFPDSNATWVNVAYYVDGPFPFLTWQYVTTVDNYCVGNQDTVIGAYTYNQIHYCEGNYKGAYRDNGGQVFFIPKDSTAEIIWYDFTLDEGDTINSYSETLWMCDYYIVSNIDSVEINGIYRTIVEFEMGDPWIEGIGCTSGLFWDHCANNNISGGYFELYCFSQNDTIYDPVSYNFIPGVQCLLPQVGFENKSEFSLIDVYPN
ncbi:MAG: hypothetical protein JNJ99_13715, partial [Crocinitomicaceae bacterium]|nr:hypothetical protein [Crocinitomicaceae bacterium]